MRSLPLNLFCEPRCHTQEVTGQQKWSKERSFCREHTWGSTWHIIEEIERQHKRTRAIKPLMQTTTTTTTTSAAAINYQAILIITFIFFLSF